MSSWQWIVNILVTLFVGSIAGWVASYINYDVRKRTNRSDRRIASIDTWRKEIIAPWKPESGILAIGPEGHWITNTEAYASLAEHLSPRLREQIEAEKGSRLGSEKVRIYTDGEAQLRLKLINEINEIERKWKLI